MAKCLYLILELITSPCYNCLFPRNDEEQNLKCSDHGVFSPLVGLVGSIQAGEAIKGTVKHRNYTTWEIIVNKP